MCTQILCTEVLPLQPSASLRRWGLTKGLPSWVNKHAVSWRWQGPPSNTCTHKGTFWDAHNVGLSMNGPGWTQHTLPMDTILLPWHQKYKLSDAQQGGRHKAIDRIQNQIKMGFRDLSYKRCDKGPRRHGGPGVHFCCLISSSINYKRMQPGLFKSPKVLVLGPLSLFPRKVISLLFFLFFFLHSCSQ